MHKPLLVLLVMILVLPVQAAQGPSTTPAEPATPGDYVVTPNGYFNRECVIQVAPGETVTDEGIIGADGVLRKVPPCPYPRYGGPTSPTRTTSGPPAASAGAVTAPASAESSGFVAAAKRNFARLDRDHDGTLTLDELELALQDPQYLDEDAAAVSALMWGAQPAKGSRVPGSYRVADPDNDFDRPQLTRADGGVAVGAVGAKFYKAGLTRLRHADRALFASSVPHITAIRQTWDSDCYFNSAVGAVALVTPERILRMIQKEPGGGYRVTFPLKESQFVPEPTDAELAAFTNASDGIWFNLLEKAYSPFKRIRPVVPNADPLDAVAVRGGNGGAVLQVLTGHGVKRVNLPAKTGKPASPRLGNEVRQALISAQLDHRAVVTGMRKHTYAVTSFDPKMELVRIHNPYDNAGVEHLSGGQQVQRDAEGFFTVPLRQFIDSFRVLVVESSE